MSENKLAYDFWNTPEGIRSQKIFDMRDRIRRLEASNKEMLEELELHKEKCKYLEIYDSCKECTMNESCGLLRVINKAKVVQG